MSKNLGNKVGTRNHWKFSQAYQFVLRSFNVSKISYIMESNELGISVACEQKVIVKQGKVCANTENRLREYIQNVLNNSKIQDVEIKTQLPFYRAHLYKETEKSEYIIIFHLYSKDFWTKKANEHESSLKTYFAETFGTEKKSSDKKKDSSDAVIVENGLDTLKVIEHVKRLVRVPTSFDGTFQEDDHSIKNIEGRTCLQKFLAFWLVVPSVQWDFFDLLYQMYTFDIFHQGVISKCVHFLTIPTNAMLSMMFLAQFNICGELQWGAAFSVNFAFIMFLVLGISYIAMGFLHKCWQWGVVTFIILAVLNMTGNLWYYSYRTPGNPWYNPTNWYINPLIWSYIISFVQAFSHGFEQEIPPNISGASHWESLHVFVCHRSKKQKSMVWSIIFFLAAILLFPVLSVSVAWFSWPHLIGTEIIYIMAGIGYRADFFEKFIRIAEKAERSGNPIIDHFPKNKDDIHFDEHRKILAAVTKDIEVTETIETEAVYKDIAMRKLAETYLRGGVSTIILRDKIQREVDKKQKEGDEMQKGDKREIKTKIHLDVMEAVLKGTLQKVLTMKRLRKKKNRTDISVPLYLTKFH
ncbi:unnamed protein product [Mytilus coruscus]|uniref:Uncharacterized protein n=1 Tax=Mytilus coruscus TaxID=42192 RepID=A0A6J8CR02_MYTCO|nr:unnamed protein product [Mytilus coruscus]